MVDHGEVTLSLSKGRHGKGLMKSKIQALTAKSQRLTAKSPEERFASSGLKAKNYELRMTELEL